MNFKENYDSITIKTAEKYSKDLEQHRKTLEKGIQAIKQRMEKKQKNCQKYMVDVFTKKEEFEIVSVNLIELKINFRRKPCETH